MQKSFFVGGLVLLILGGLVMSANFNTYKNYSWSDVSQDRPIIYLNKLPRYGHVAITDSKKDMTVKVEVTTGADDKVLLLLMTPESYSKYLSSTVGKSDVLVWQDAAGQGQSVSFVYQLPASTDYDLVIHPVNDANGDGVQFTLNLSIEQPQNATLPGLGIAVVGIVFLLVGLIKSPAQRAPQITSTQPLSAIPATSPAQFCINCGQQLPAASRFCKHCGTAQQ